MLLCDSNILVYSINRSSPKNKKAQDFLQNNAKNLVIAHQNIFETICVLTHPKFPNPMPVKFAIEAIERITDVCKVIAPNLRTHHMALALIAKYKLNADKIYDAYLVATALSNEIQKIATDNIRDFRKFNEISITNPLQES